MRAIGLLVALLVSTAQAATPTVSAGATHSLALHADGSVRSWGNDNAGALGLGRSLASATPIHCAFSRRPLAV